jgi:hypothetical protein
VVRGVTDTAHHWSLVSLTLPPVVSIATDTKFSKFFGEDESIFKKALTRDSVSQEELIDEKNRGRKSRDTFPLHKINFSTRLKGH